MVAGMSQLAKFVPSASAFLVGMGVQVSGYTNPTLAVAFFALAVALLIIPAWPYLVKASSGLTWLWRMRRSSGKQILSADTTKPGPMATHAGAKDAKYVEIGDWRTLYDLEGDGSVKLRFLPDTGLDQQLDTVLLIVLGYRIVNKCESVPIAVVNNESRRAFLEAPNRDRVNLANLGAELSHTLKPPDYGANAVSFKYLDRVGLSEGGAYRLTERGRFRAEKLAADLIRRA